MLNALRILFLLLSLLAAATVWIVQERPEWIGSVDRWSTARHLAEPQETWDRVVAGEWQGTALVERLEGALADMGDVQLGDRRYPLWKAMVQRLVSEGIEQGELTEAAAWQGRLALSDPTEVRERMAWCERLLALGDPDSVEQAQVELQVLHRKLPEWSPPIQALLDLAIAGEDRAAIEAWMPYWSQAERNRLRSGWQVLAWGIGQGKVWASPKLDARYDEASGLWSIRGQGWPFPSLQRLRVDPPPGATGWIQEWTWQFLTDTGEAVNVPMQRAADMVREPEAHALGLYAANDPRMTSEVLPASAAEGAGWTEFRFRWQPSVPEALARLAKRHPDWKAAWQTQAWWGPPVQEPAP